MSPRLFDRLAAAASVLILVGLGMVSYYFAQLAEQSQAAPARANRPDPDFFVEGMSLMRVNKAGSPTVRVEAEKMLHYPLDSRVDFTEPRIISLDDAQPLTTVTARRGTAPDNGDMAELQEDVRVNRVASTGPDGKTSAPMQLFTDSARVDMAAKIVSTEDPVIMLSGENQLEAIGMEIREQTNELKLFSRVKGVFPPANHNDGS